MANAEFVEEMMREQSVLEATCGDLFDHINDLLDLFEESAADVLLLDALGLPCSDGARSMGKEEEGNWGRTWSPTEPRRRRSCRATSTARRFPRDVRADGCVQSKCLTSL